MSQMVEHPLHWREAAPNLLRACYCQRRYRINVEDRKQTLKINPAVSNTSLQGKPSGPKRTTNRLLSRPMRLPSAELSQALRRYFLKSKITSKTDGRATPSNRSGHLRNASDVLCFSNVSSVKVCISSAPKIGGLTCTYTVAEQV